MKELYSMIAQCCADALCLFIASQIFLPGRVVVCMGRLGGAMNKARRTIHQCLLQLLADPVPDIGMVGSGKRRDCGAMNGIEREGARRDKIVPLTLINPQHGHGRVDGLHGITVWGRHEIVLPGLK